MKIFISIISFITLLFVGVSAWGDDSDYVYHSEVKSEIKARLFTEDEDNDFSKVEAVEEEDEFDNAKVLARKKGKKGKQGSLGADSLEDSTVSVPPCKPKVCSIKDEFLPDGICRNDCPKGSGSHCQGRHYTQPIEINIAFCVPD